jgi:mRNA-degrading endonuclease RelE of RelBE toxin-antitoxin system
MSTWVFTVTDTFLNELLDLPPDVSKRVTRKVRILEKDPISAGGDAKKLQGYENVYRVRLGDYRLLYSFGQGWVKLLSVRKRDKKTYKSPLLNFEIPELPPPPVESDFQPPEPLAYPVPITDELSKQSYPNPIGIKLTSDQLKRWKIPQEYWSDLMRVKTEDDLLNQPLPNEFLSRIIDNLFPQPLEEIIAQPEYLLKEPEDLDHFVEGDLIGFLLKLDPEQEKLVKRNSTGAMLIKGGPGTGKSILALYRVKKLVEEGKTPILFTTYTNTLVNYSRQLLKQLLGKSPEAAGVEVTTIDTKLQSNVVDRRDKGDKGDKGDVL